MMAIKYRLNEVPQLQNKAIFVDANVLIYLFWPTGNIDWEKKYASAIAKLIKQKNPLYVDFLVISEVVNRSFKIAYEAKKSSDAHLRYKQFRDSEEGQQELAEVYSIVENQILTQFNVIGNAFSKADILDFLTVDSLDFLDKGILKTCQNNHFVLLTNDKDFKNVDIDILTCNPAI